MTIVETQKSPQSYLAYPSKLVEVGFKTEELVGVFPYSNIQFH